MEPLFLETATHRIKQAADNQRRGTPLPDAIEEWPHAILQEAFTKAPFIHQFDPEVIMEKVDERSRTAMGYLSLISPHRIEASRLSTVRASGIRQAKIPFVVQAGRLAPLDLLVDDTGSFLPLTDRRVRAAVFRPVGFDLGDMPEARTGLADALAVPGIEGRRQGPLKMAEASAAPPPPPADVIALARKKLEEKKKSQGSTLSDALEMTPKGVYLGTVDKVAQDHQLAQMLSENPVCRTALATVAQYTEPQMAPIEKLAKQTVVQIRSIPGGYAIKSASPYYYRPREVHLDRPGLYHTLAQSYGGAQAQQTTLDVDLHGAVTTLFGKTASEAANGPQTELITSFGVYRVATADGKEVVGYVFPSLISEEGEHVPVAMFVNGESMALKPEIYGVRVSEGAFMFESRPMHGNGFFYRSKHGVTEATVPLEPGHTVRGLSSAQAVTTMMTYDGNPVSISVEPSVYEVTAGPAEEGAVPTLLVPSDFRWFSLEQCRSIALADSPEQAQAVKSAQAHHQTVEVVATSGGGTLFSLRGAPVAKLARDQRESLDKEEVVFLLGCMGVPPKVAYQRMGQSMATHAPATCQVQTPILHVGDPEREKAAEARKVDQCAKLRVNLWKEAAFMDDSATVDSLLSVGFLSDDNIHTFISHLPDIERSVRSLGQMLFASRLGLKIIPEEPLASALKQLEKVVEGLRALAFSRSGT